MIHLRAHAVAALPSHQQLPDVYFLTVDPYDTSESPYIRLRRPFVAENDFGTFVYVCRYVLNTDLPNFLNFRRLGVGV